MVSLLEIGIYDGWLLGSYLNMAHMSAAGEVLVRCCVFSAQSDYIRINQGQGLMSIPASQPRHLSPEQPSPALSGHSPQIQGPARGASSVKKSSNLRRFTVPGAGEGPYPLPY